MPITSLPPSDATWARRYTCLAVFLFFAISLVVPSGYSVGAALLFLAGLGVLVRRQVWPVLDRSDRTLLWVCALFFAGWAFEIVLDGQSLSRFDKPVRILCAMIALLWLLRHPPKAVCFWGGIVTGAILVGAWAGWQKLVLGIDRAQGYTVIIQFGNISMLLGMLCLVGVGWAWFQTRSRAWAAVLTLGFFCGMAGSLFSGTRGGWIGAPFVLMMVLVGYRDRLPRHVLGGFVLFVAVLLAGLYAIPATGIQSRVGQAVSDIRAYLDEGNVMTSVGARFEMWRAGAQVVAESPLIGMGGQGMARHIEALAEQGRIDPVVTQFGHLHNEFIDTAARRGLIGLALLLAVYLVPLRLFAAWLRRPGSPALPYALAGSVVCVSYIDYGLTQTFLSHNSGVMVYFFGLVICWAMTRTAQAMAPVS